MRSPVGSSRTRESGVSGSSGVSIGSARSARASMRWTPSRASTTSTSSPPACSTSSGPLSGRVRSSRPTIVSPVAAPGTRPASRWLASSGPGTTRRPSSANTSTASAMPRPTPPCASDSRSENTPISASSRWRSRSSGAFSSATMFSKAYRSSQNERMPDCSACWSSVNWKSIVLPRLLRHAEDPLRDDVALHLRAAGRDGERERLQELDEDALDGQPADVVAREPRAAEQAQAQLVDALLQLREGELQRRAAEARNAGLLDLGELPLHQCPERIGLGGEVADVAAQRLVLPRRRVVARELLRELRALAQELLQLGDVGRPRGAALEAQRHVRDAPAVVLLADELLGRDAHVGEEHLREVALALQRRQRAHVDARQVHGHDHPADALVLRRARVRAHQQLAVVGDLAERSPDLVAVHDVVIAVAHRRRLQRGEVRAGGRLGEALAPHLLAAQDARQVSLLLELAAFGDHRGAAVADADEVHADVGHVCARGLLVVDQLLGQRRAAPAVLLRPVHAGIAGVEELLLPARVEDAPCGPVVTRRGLRVLRDLGGQPAAQLAAELLVGLGVTQIHARSPRKWPMIRSVSKREKGGSDERARAGERL